MSLNIADLFTDDWNITQKDNAIVCSRNGYELDVFEVKTLDTRYCVKVPVADCIYYTTFGDYDSVYNFVKQHLDTYQASLGYVLDGS